MTRKDAERLTRQLDLLRGLGFTREEAEQLRRISMTLHRWHELECGGGGDGQTDVRIERDGPDGDGVPFKVIGYPTPQGYKQHRYRIADRERGALKRLHTVIDARNARAEKPVSAYIQGDPRGAALYILRPGDVPDGAPVDSYYSRGVCVW